MLRLVVTIVIGSPRGIWIIMRPLRPLRGCELKTLKCHRPLLGTHAVKVSGHHFMVGLCDYMAIFKTWLCWFVWTPLGDVVGGQLPNGLKFVFRSPSVVDVFLRVCLVEDQT
jgi:hypothetical protein